MSPATEAGRKCFCYRDSPSCVRRVKFDSSNSPELTRAVGVVQTLPMVES